MNLNGSPLELSFAHTPDADDAFMLYALTAEKLISTQLKLKHVIKPIQDLNTAAMQGVYDISALSLGAYPYVSEHYNLLPAGACMGFNYGPMLLSAKPLSRLQLKATTIAIPGKLTTAYLVLRLFEPDLSVVEMKFDRIPEAIVTGEVGAGLVIHEAQLTHERLGLAKVVDLGQWWQDETGLPLPLGGNIIRKTFSQSVVQEVTRLYQASIKYALENKDEAISFCMQYARGMSLPEADKFVSMYVNESTIDYGQLGKTAVDKLFELAYQKGVLKQKMQPAFVGAQSR